MKNFNKKDNIDYIENVLEMDSELVLNILNIINNKMTSVQTDKCFNYVN